ncbi:hypothetical protein [Ruminococcus sp.]|uniref:hypothetical protein n=1 Tax=Ruminococcus sp. TaxID=41978 RepID=UPI0025D85CB5|nr:hypothetical protein [Ruminococcus sp.]MBQ9542281.1 hypothetical protein [Ruminococcus sp.]
MSATVPEDVQISLGRIGTISGGTITASTKESDASLANGKGGLVSTSSGVTAPSEDWDWSNIADISEYYQFGKWIPASSTDGSKIFFTPNANGNGQTIAQGATFYAANDATNILTAKTEADVTGTGSNPLNATAHIINSKSGGVVTDTWSTGVALSGQTAKYTGSTGWNATADDGYYIDIPVWLRTSSASGAKLSVLAYVKPRNTTQTNSADGDALYRAVRVAIIEDVVSGSGTSATTTSTTHGILPITDGWNVSADGTTAGTLKDAPFQLTKATYAESILNWYGRDLTTGASATTALTALTGKADGAKAAASATTPAYDKATVYDPFTSNDNVVATLAAPTKDDNGVKTANYGTPTKITVRVWLEGEDPDCWNDTAGQDWSINLKFNNETTNPTAANATTVGGTDLPGVNKGAAPHS